MSGAVSNTVALSRGRELEIAAALGIPLSPRGRHIHCPMPQYHQRGDKIASFRLDPAKGRYFCSTHQGDMLDLVREMGHAHDALSAAQWTREKLGLEPLGQRKPETSAQRAERERKASAASAAREVERITDESRRIALARKLYKAGVPIANTMGEDYLRTRHYAGEPPLHMHFLAASGAYPASVLTPFGEWSWTKADKWQPPAPDQITAVHRIFVKREGKRVVKAEHDGKSKQAYGVIAGQPIVISPCGRLHELAIAEGVENGLSAFETFGCETWAAGFAGNMPRLAELVFPATETITILADHDKPGIRAAEQLKAALESTHLVHIDIAVPARD